MSLLQIFIHPVGAGHAVHVFTPDDRVVVVDTGASESFSPLEWLRGITDRIDRLIISHPHGDHIQEIDQLRRFNSIGLFERIPNLNEGPVRAANQGRYEERLNTYFNLDRKWNAPVTNITSTGTAAGVAIETFYAPGTGLSNLNNFSLVVSIRYGGWEFLIPGDNEPPSWKALSAVPRFAQLLRTCDVFLASHHGRESGYCDTTLPSFLNPRLCIISDGQVRDTDASDKYRGLASGLKVLHGSAKVEDRFVVTTRFDGRVQGTLEARTDSTYLTMRVENG